MEQPAVKMYVVRTLGVTLVLTPAFNNPEVPRRPNGAARACLRASHRGKRSFYSRDARSSDTSASLRTGAVPLAAALALIFSADSLALSVSRAFQWSWNLRLG